MARQPTRCKQHDRVSYRHQQQAITAAVRLYQLVPEGSIAVYYCDEARSWHVTTTSFQAALVRTG